MLAVPAFAASCRSCVVSPIIRVRSGLTPSSSISSSSIRGCGLEAVSSAVRVASNKPLQMNGGQHVVEPRARLAGGHGEQMAALLEFTEQGQHALEERQLVLACDVVVAVAGAEFAIALERASPGAACCSASTSPMPIT